MIDETKSEVALGPCPFCGSRLIGHVGEDDDDKAAACVECEAQGPVSTAAADHRATYTEATDLWNARTSPAEPSSDTKMGKS